MVAEGLNRARGKRKDLFFFFFLVLPHFLGWDNSPQSLFAPDYWISQPLYLHRPTLLLFTCLSIFFLFACLSTCLSVCLSICGSLMRIVSHGLSTWFPFGGAIWGDSTVLLDEIYHWGQTLRVPRLAPHVLAFYFVIVITYVISQHPLQHGGLLSLWNLSKISSSFYKLFIVFYLTNEKVTDTSFNQLQALLLWRTLTERRVNYNSQ